MKIFKIIVIFIVVVLVGIQLIPTTRNQSNVVLETDFSKTFDVPNNIQQILKTSCYDCHSNNTAYPCYNTIQPFAWYLEDHIKEGKAELNFNEWDTYSSRRKNSKLRSMMKQIESGEMPLESYTLIHGDAILSKAQQTEVIEYLLKLQENTN
jgi:hypothetical protein